MDTGQGKKTGQVAKIFGISQKTITRWVDEFSDYFSKDAQGAGRSQRSFHAEDFITLNTIKIERIDRNSDTEKIRALLVAGERHTTLPPEAITLEGDTAVMVYIELNTVKQSLKQAEAEIERLRKESQEKDERLLDMSKDIGK